MDGYLVFFFFFGFARGKKPGRFYFHGTKAERGFHDSGGVFKIGINFKKRIPMNSWGVG